MKNISAVTIFICFMLILAGCISAEQEEKLLGTWISGDGVSTVSYSFEKDSDKYIVVIAEMNHGQFNLYEDAEYEVSEDKIMIYGDRGIIEHKFKLRDGFLYIDNLKFTKMD